MFKRKKAHKAVSSSQEVAVAAPRPGEVTLTQGAGELLLATAITRMQSDVGALLRQVTEQNQNMHAVNLALGHFREKLVEPLLAEMKHLRYNLGDRLGTEATNLSVYVARLDQVLWGALRASGLTDEQIRQYREEHGMQPEAPRGFEMEAHINRVEQLERSNQELVRQNRRLLAKLDGRHMFAGDTDWEYQGTCPCTVCTEQRKRHDAALEETERA